MTRHSLTRTQRALDMAQRAANDAPALKRLALLARLTDGAWMLGVVDRSADQRRLVAQVRTAVAPLPVVPVSLDRSVPDPLLIVRGLMPELSVPNALISFTDVGRALPDLFGYLDLERDTLARLAHRLLFWVSPEEQRALARHAPNFYSRLSGVFHFERAAQPVPVPRLATVAARHTLRRRPR